ncbi:DUF2141 domain-containing protein [Teichococcus wenyumeiae]|uniref:DUF2141 domain-containing protein n=1 Tax=Teichococcus wenyumeiae TaxID=2478470 RepID=UPI0013154895|nr:DUF2141 domain-containing protein [Pseudoroseomonas wenyumeiae]
MLPAVNIVSPASDDEGRLRRLRRGWPVLLAMLALAPLTPARAAEQVAGTCGEPGAPSGPRIEVVVTGARKVAGNMTITLYGSRPEGFLARNGKLARQRVPMRGTQAEACFAVSAPGVYAVAVYHDENNDHDFNRTLLGMPAEGYGFSNDAPTVIGLPSFESVRFQVGPEGARVPIRLRY